MAPTRREFLVGSAGLGAACALSGEEKGFFKLYPIGKVEKKDKQVYLHIDEKYRDALLGLEGWSHIDVFYWFDRNDTPIKRSILRVHPRGDRKNPLTGVFACRAPVRPNLIALSVCKILAVEGAGVRIDAIDAFDGTPILDLKPFVPPDAPTEDLRTPPWTKKARRRR